MMTTKARNGVDQPNPIPAENVRDQLQKVLASPGFFRSPRMQRFLTFVVELRLNSSYQSAELKESVIGIAVFDRKAGYDPKQDLVVRVEARRLRAKLEDYYAANGSSDTIRIEIPKGSYALEWQWISRPPAGVALKPSRVSSLTLLSFALLMLALTVGVSLWLKRQKPLKTRYALTSNPKIRSLVVLPFQNLTGDPSQEYLVAGLTDELTTDLARIKNLKVISRTSAERYRSTRKRLPAIARELRVDAVVEGSIRRSTSSFHVTAQLIRAATDSHLWADSYKRPVSDFVTLQTDIAKSIAQEIGASLIQSSETVVPENPPLPEAYDLYLRGRFFWNKRTLEGLNKSIDCFSRAIKIDPTYARYAALGDSYVLLSSYGGPAPDVSFTRARQSAERALSLDPSLAEAYTVLAAG